MLRSSIDHTHVLNKRALCSVVLWELYVLLYCFFCGVNNLDVYETSAPNFFQIHNTHYVKKTLQFVIIKNLAIFSILFLVLFLSTHSSANSRVCFVEVVD